MMVMMMLMREIHDWKQNKLLLMDTGQLVIMISNHFLTALNSFAQVFKFDISWTDF